MEVSLDNRPLPAPAWQAGSSVAGSFGPAMHAQQRDRQLELQESALALPVALSTGFLSRMVAQCLPPVALFRACSTLPAFYCDPPAVSTFSDACAAVARATSPSEAMAGLNRLLEKGVLAPAMVAYAIASFAASPMTSMAKLLIGAVVCGVQDGMMNRLLQHVGVPRQEAARCLVEAQRLHANGSAAWGVLQETAAPLSDAVVSLLADPADIDVVQARIDAIDDIHRMFQGSLLDEERIAAAQRDGMARHEEIDVGLRGMNGADSSAPYQERARLEFGLSLLQALSEIPQNPEDLAGALNALHDARAQLASTSSSAGGHTWQGRLLSWLPACLLGVRNVLPHTVQDTVAAPFIPQHAGAVSVPVASAATRSSTACGAIRRNPMVATGAFATVVITGLLGGRLISQATAPGNATGAGMPDPAEGADEADTPLALARTQGRFSPEGQFADGSSSLCIGVYLHDDLLPTDLRIEEIHRKYFSWLLQELKTVFPGKHIYFHYMKQVPGITDMSYRTAFDELRSLDTFTQKAMEHRMGGAIPFNYMHKYLLMTDCGPSLLIDGIAGRVSAIASDNRYGVPAHEIGHMLDAEHEHARVHYNGWWCGTLMKAGAANLFRSTCYFFSEENRQRMRAHQKDWANPPYG